jgi:hypothetical protein
MTVVLYVWIGSDTSVNLDFDVLIPRILPLSGWPHGSPTPVQCLVCIQLILIYVCILFVPLLYINKFKFIAPFCARSVHCNNATLLTSRLPHERKQIQKQPTKYQQIMTVYTKFQEQLQYNNINVVRYSKQNSSTVTGVSCQT